MKIGIMQPYFFPYIGYWQLLNGVDKYVVFDDVNFINRGWINRNRILINGKPSYFNLPLHKASQNKKINQISVDLSDELVQKMLKTLYLAYKKAPYFEEVYVCLENILRTEKINLGEFLVDSIQKVCDYLGIKTELILSSSLEKRNELKGEDKILDICKILKGNEYWNAIGGQSLYSAEKFKEQGIKLSFVNTQKIEYKQFDNGFQENLSIIDVMMFNSIDTIRDMLNKYILI